MIKYLLSIILLFSAFGAYALDRPNNDEIWPDGDGVVVIPSPDWDFLKIKKPRQLTSPEAVTLAEQDHGTYKVTTFRDIKGMAKPEVGWRS